MAEEMAEVNLDGLRRLQSAAEEFARPEVIRIAESVIGELQSRSAIGIHGQVAARHMWDEYCWTLQEDAFDDEGSSNWDEAVRAFVSESCTSSHPNLSRNGRAHA